MSFLSPMSLGIHCSTVECAPFALLISCRPPLPEAEELFSHEQGKPFTELLTFAEEYEANSTGNRAVYQQSVAYLAFVHKSIVQELDAPLINCQRLVAMPSQLGRQFTELIEQRAPRALLLLAHIFAMTKLLSDQVPWLRGIAERQVGGHSMA